MIELQFVGTGGAHDVSIGNSSALVEVGGERVLLDCGFTVYPRLAALHKVDELDAVLVTHLHDDHVGSLSALLYHRYFAPGSERLKLYYPDAFADTLMGWLGYAMQRPEDFCTPVPLSEVKGIDPIDTYGRHFAGMPTYGYHFYDGEDSVVFSGDLADTDYLFGYLEAQGIAPRVVYHDVSLYETPVHAHYRAVARYLDRYSIVGYHHNHTHNPDDNPVPLAGLLPQAVIRLPA